MDWKDYISKIKSCAERNIYIYGAGRIGIKLYEKLKTEGIRVKAFLVTDASMNRRENSGVPIIQFDRISDLPENVLILIGIKKPWNNEIIKTLNDAGFNNYLDVIESVERLSEKPILFEITTCIGCSVACKYCPQKILTRKYQGNRMLQFESFKLAIDKVPKDRMIAFSGFSEPFLNPNCADMICYAHELGHPIMLATTLVGMTMHDFEKIKHIPFHIFTLHLPDKVGNANIPMTDEYFELLDAVLDARKIVDGKEQPLIGKANCQGEIHPLIKKRVAGRTMIFAELADRAGNLEPDNIIHSIGTLSGCIYCNYSPSLDNNVMLPNGDVVLCCMDFGMRHILGNIFTQSFEEIRTSPNLQMVRNGLVHSEGADVLCRHCSEAKEYAKS